MFLSQPLLGVVREREKNGTINAPYVQNNRKPVCRCYTEEEFGLVPAVFFYGDSIY